MLTLFSFPQKSSIDADGQFRVFPISVKGQGKILPLRAIGNFAWEEFFLLGGGNTRSDFDHSNLFQI